MSYTPLPVPQDPEQLPAYLYGEIQKLRLEINRQPVGCLVYLDANQTIATSTFDEIDFDTETYDDLGIHSNTTNTSRLTVPSGVTRIRCTASLQFAANATGDRAAFIIKNAAAVAGGAAIRVRATAAGLTILNPVTAVLEVTEDDYFELQVWQDSGGNLNVNGGTTETWFAMEVVE